MFAIQSRDSNKCKIKIDAHHCLLFAPKPCRAVKFVSCERKRDHSIQWKTRKTTQNNPTNKNKKKVSQNVPAIICRIIALVKLPGHDWWLILWVQEKKSSIAIPNMCFRSYISRRLPTQRIIKGNIAKNHIIHSKRHFFCEDVFPQMVSIEDLAK